MKTPESATDNNVGRKAPENVPETNVGKINGRTPDEIKKGLECCGKSAISCDVCPYEGECHLPFGSDPESDALAYIQQLESTYSQVSKALCGKENASLEEVLQAASQLKSRLAQVERERDVALSEWKRTKLDSEGMCWTCKHGLITSIGSCRCVSPDPCDDGENWEWRGVSEEKKKGDTDA